MIDHLPPKTATSWTKSQNLLDWGDVHVFSVGEKTKNMLNDKNNNGTSIVRKNHLNQTYQVSIGMDLCTDFS